MSVYDEMENQDTDLMMDADSGRAVGPGHERRDGVSCEYCKHESMAYSHHKDEAGRDVYTKIAATIPYDECLIDAEPMISWWMPKDAIDWADYLPRLCVTAYDQDGNEECVSIPIKHCPMCGRELPKAVEVQS